MFREVEQNTEKVSGFMGAGDVMCFVFDEEFLHGIETDGFSEFGFDGERSFVEACAIDCIEDAVELSDAFQIIDICVMCVESAVISEQTVAVFDERIFRIFEFASLPELGRNHMLFLEDMIDVRHAVAIRAGKCGGIIGVNTSAAADT